MRHEFGERIRHPVGWAARAAQTAGWVGFVALMIVAGFPVEPAEKRVLEGAVHVGVAAWALELALRLAASRNALGLLRERLPDLLLYTLVWMPSVAKGGEWLWALLPYGRESAVRGILMLLVLVRTSRGLGLLGTLGVRVPVLLFGTFGALIITGTCLLLLPRSHAPGQSIGFVDALFTATSASCVTGLTVFDVGTTLSGFGQGMLMLLIQFGGVGIVTFALIFMAMSRGGLNVRQMVAARELMSGRRVGEARSILWSVLGVTLTIELTGAAILFLLVRNPPGGTSRPWFAVFHSVSAFCNAGFALPPDNLTGFAHRPLVLATLAALIVIGGLGFTTVLDVAHWVRDARKRFFFFALGKRGMPPPRPQLALQGRISVTAAAILITLGGIGLFAFEWVAQPPGASASHTASLALFHSVSARTAGFNASDIGAHQPGSAWLLIVWMGIGAAPGSTGGGVKTVTVAVLLAAVVATVRGRDSVEIGRRRIAFSIVNGAIAVIGVYSLTAFAATLAMTVTDAQIPAGKLLFEVISALSTVGLTSGITPEISTGGKLVLTLTMFLGRVGPLSLITLIAGSAKPRSFEYPVEPVSLG